MKGWQVNDESERFERKQPCPRHYPGIRLKGLRKTAKELSQDSRSPGRDLKPGSLHPECLRSSYASLILLVTTKTAEVGRVETHSHEKGVIRYLVEGNNTKCGAGHEMLKLKCVCAGGISDGSITSVKS
jgi:hypothetical protein